MVWNTTPTPSQISASLGNDIIRHVFLFNPDEVKWGYSNNTVSRDTIGGRVVQLLSAKVEQMTVVGRAGSREELQKIALNLKKIMNYQIKNQTPIRFKVPSKKWNFKVYLQNVSSLGWDYAATSYPYELTLLVQEDLTGLTSKVIMGDAISRLAQSIGYSENFHGGNGDQALAVSEAYQRGMNWIKTGGSNVVQGTPGGTTVPGDGSGGTGAAGTQQYKGRTDLWQPGIANLPWQGANLREAVRNMLNTFVTRSAGNANFTAVDVEIAMCVIKHESGWNPQAYNDQNSNGSIDYGLWQINTIHRNATWWPSNVDLLKNAEYNTRCALSLWIPAGWNAWNAYKNTDNGCQAQ